MSASTLPSSQPAADVAATPVRNRTLLTLAVMGATIIQILDSTIANVAIPHMQSSLGATRDTVTWILTSYIIASAVAMPVTGWLADRVGSRNLFVWSVMGFIITSMLCGLSANLTQMVVFRTLQGFSAAFIGPLSQTLMLDINPPSRQSKAMAMWGMGIMVAPIFGPMIGGWLTESYNWRWVFYINLPIGIPTIVILWWLLPSRPINKRTLDLFGFAMLALGLATFQLMLDRGGHVDWFESWEIRIEALVAISAIWMFAVHSSTAKRPLFDRALLSNANFGMAAVMMTLLGFMMYAIFALLPPLLQTLFGYPVLDTGVLLAPRGVGVLISMFVAPRLTARFDARLIVACGFGVAAISMWLMMGWSLETPASQIVMNGFVQGLGMGLVFMPLNGIAFATVAPHLRTQATSVAYLLRSIGASAGISLTTAMLARNIQVAHEDLAGHVTASTISTIDASAMDRFGDYGEAALRMVDLEINRQATMIAYLDDFKLVMFIILAFIPLVALLKKPPPQPAKQNVAAD